MPLTEKEEGDNKSSQMLFNPNVLTADQFSLVPTFSGTVDSQDVKEYFETVEEIAEHFGWSKENLYLAVKLKLLGESLNFFREQKYVIKDYSSLKRVFIEQYSKEKCKTNLIHQFFTFTQPLDMPVAVFLSKATSLSFQAFCPGEDEPDIEEKNRLQMLKSMLLANLTPEIRRGVVAANPKSIEQIKESALLQERAWNACLNGRNPFMPQQSQVLAIEKRTEECERDEICKKLIEKVENLTLKVDSLSKRDVRSANKENLCFACNRPGHIARFCPNMERQGARYEPRSRNRPSGRQEYQNEGYAQRQESRFSRRDLN